MIKEISYKQFGGLWSVVLHIGNAEHVLSPEVADVVADMLKWAAMKGAMANQDARSKETP